MDIKRIAILGATGSIGRQALEVIRGAKELSAVALACRFDAAGLAEAARELYVENLYIADKSHISNLGKYFKLHDSMTKLLKSVDFDVALFAATVDKDNFGDMLAAAKYTLESGKTAALASKELIVAAGDELKTAEKRGGGKIIPVDSEHSAIFQCLEAAGGNQIKRIYLTASGGAFRDLPPEQLKRASAADALKHPVWNMGKKVTIDSATMANKGLEVIEAVRLFGASPEAVSVLIHRESIIHSMVEFFDGAVLAQLGRPDMKLPINYALSYPKRQNGAAEPLDFDKIGGLSISGWDEKRWPCLKLAYQAAAAGGVYPTVYAAADDLAVKLYAAGRLDYFGVSDLICEALALGYDFAPTDYKGIYLKIEQYISSRL